MKQYNSYNQDLGKISIPEKELSILENGMVKVPTSDNSQIAVISDMQYVSISTELLDKINTTFTEFVNTATVSIDLSVIEEEISSTQSYHSDSTLLIDKSMTRDVIVELRMKLGEGELQSEFSDNFPYEKI